MIIKMTPEQLEDLEDLRKTINNIAEFFLINNITDLEKFEKELDEEYRKKENIREKTMRRKLDILKDLAEGSEIIFYDTKEQKNRLLGFDGNWYIKEVNGDNVILINRDRAISIVSNCEVMNIFAEKEKTWLLEEIERLNEKETKP